MTQCYGNIPIEGEDNLSNLWFFFLFCEQGFKTILCVAF